MAKRTVVFAIFALCCSALALNAQTSDASDGIITIEPAESVAPNASPEPSPLPSPARPESGSAKTDMSAVMAAVDTNAKRLDALTAEITTMRAEISGRFDILEGISKRLKSVELDYLGAEALGTGYKQLDTALFTKLLHSGFTPGEAKIGTWEKSKDGNSISQKDSKAFFAKYRIPVAQPLDKRILYSFKAGSTSKDTVGIGLHISVSDMPMAAKNKAYWGEGKSILIWFAKDPLIKKNRASYLQIYKSDSQVNLERVFDSKMLDGFTDMDQMKADVLYDPVDNYLLVQVNGKIKVVYKLPFILPEGREIALRTVGSGCVFSELKVYAEE
jgi:hypothetical protein